MAQLNHPLGPVPFDDLKVAVRGVVRIGADCPYCSRPVAVFGKVGKGRPLDTFSPGYFCGGHAITVESARSGLTDEQRKEYAAWGVIEAPQPPYAK